MFKSREKKNSNLPDDGEKTEGIEAAKDEIGGQSFKSSSL